ncbi:Uncharacterised protein [uncultured archaeon]|nr:Uncharacterised protein [uncultured archaeon]
MTIEQLTSTQIHYGQELAEISSRFANESFLASAPISTIKQMMESIVDIRRKMDEIKEQLWKIS